MCDNEAKFKLNSSPIEWTPCEICGQVFHCNPDAHIKHFLSDLEKRIEAIEKKLDIEKYLYEGGK